MTPLNHSHATGSAADVTTELPTFAGRVPRGLEHTVVPVRVPTLPELASLPRPRERCPVTDKSRTWLLEANEEARRDGMPFIFRVRQRGKMRGAVFMRVPVLMAWLAKKEAEDNAALNGSGGGAQR